MGRFVSFSEKEEKALRRAFENAKKTIARVAPFLLATMLKPKIVAVPYKKIDTVAALSNDGTTIYVAKEVLTAAGEIPPLALPALFLHETLHAVMLDVLRLAKVSARYRADLPLDVKAHLENIVADAYNNEILKAFFGPNILKEIEELVKRAEPFLSSRKKEEGAKLVDYSTAPEFLKPFGVKITPEEFAKMAQSHTKEQMYRELLLRVSELKEGEGGEGNGGGGIGAGILNDFPMPGGGQDQNQDQGQGQSQGQKSNQGNGGGDEVVLQEGDKDWQKEVEDARASNDEEKMKKMAGKATAEILEAAKMAGKDPAALRRLFNILGDSVIPWRRIVRSTLKEAFGDLRKPSWRRPNRRGFEEFPGHKWCGKKPALIVGIDTSGSISKEELDQFITEVYHASRLRTNGLWVFSWDAEAYEPVKINNPGQVEFKLKEALKGGGGTCVSAAVEKISEILKNSAVREVIAVIITDGYWTEKGEEARRLFSELATSSRVRDILVFTTENVPPIEGVPKVKVRKISFV